VEEGIQEISPAAIALLSRLYMCERDQMALQRLAAITSAPAAGIWDRSTGHAWRLAACARQAKQVRWLSTACLPSPLQTWAYAQATDEPPAALPDAPLAPAGDAVYVLDPCVITCGAGMALRMEEQLAHLIRLANSGTTIRIAPDHPFPQPPGHLVKLSFTAGRVVAFPGKSGVRYEQARHWPDKITAVLEQTDPDGSRNALARAAVCHRSAARAPSGAC
jgi:hypothetical protein